MTRQWIGSAQTGGAQVPLPFAYGVSQFTTAPWSFEQDIEAYPGLGVEVLEVCEVKLDPARTARQLATAVEAGLRISSVQPEIRALTPSSQQPVPEDHGQRLARLRDSLDRIAPHTPGAAFITNTGPAPQENPAEAIRHAVADHRLLADIAADHGVRIALEPLSPVLMNRETTIWTYQQALDIVCDVDRDNVGICLDLWNVWQDPGLAAGVRDAPDRMFLLQVSDWRMPHSATDRRSVGTGEIPVGRLLHKIYAAGYRGPCVLEIFSEDVPDSLYETDLAAVVRENREALDRAWRQGV